MFLTGLILNSWCLDQRILRDIVLKSCYGRLFLVAHFSAIIVMLVQILHREDPIFVTGADPVLPSVMPIVVADHAGIKTPEIKELLLDPSQ